MTLSLADRSQKTSGIKILSQVGVDPDQDRKTLLKVCIVIHSFTKSDSNVDRTFALTERGREIAPDVTYIEAP